jgi:hypothetical protein
VQKWLTTPPNRSDNRRYWPGFRQYRSDPLPIANKAEAGAALGDPGQAVGVIVSISDLRLARRLHGEPPPCGIVGVADRALRHRLAGEPIDRQLKSQTSRILVL